MADDHYSLLGVPKDATTQDIKRAFRRLARECHPDVAGSDPELLDRFHKSREAYEILMDPVARARYDRRGQRRANFKGGSFFDAFYKKTGEVSQARSQQRSRTGARVKGAGAGNNMGLDDLLDGLGGGRSRTPRTETGGKGPRPAPGRDIEVEVDVPTKIARDGGSVSATYFRMRRADQWTPGDPDPGLVRVEDLVEVRVLPGSRDGTVLRENGLGDAGAWGGPAGDLHVRIRVVGVVEEADEVVVGDDLRVDISVVEALLGGRITVETPQGRVKLTIPPGSSSHSRMRLRGKGPAGVDGADTDLYVTFRVVVPRNLDSRSRELIEQFAALNPGD